MAKYKFNFYEKNYLVYNKITLQKYIIQHHIKHILYKSVAFLFITSANMIVSLAAAANGL